MTTFMERLRKAEAELAPTETGDPWRLPLERLHGKIGDDGIERITTQHFRHSLRCPNVAEEPARAAVWRKLMADLGWMAVRVRGLTRGGYMEQVRGTAATLGTDSQPIIPYYQIVFCPTVNLVAMRQNRKSRL